jgi:subtilase family protein
MKMPEFPYQGWVMRGEQPDVLAGDGFYYRPRQILFETGSGESPTVIDQLQRAGGVPYGELNKGFAQAKLPIQAYLMPPTVDIPELVTQLRERKPGQPVPNVGPNHVFCGEPNYEGGPDGEPQNATPVNEAPWSKPAARVPGIAVLDTGFDPTVPALHHGLGWRVSFPAGSQENPIAGGFITAEGGHGTFVDGVIMRLAPQVCIRQFQVLTPAGTTDDGTVANAMTHANAPVINLSLGGYALNDVAPTASSVALAHLNPNVTVVAAAGNHGSDRLFWPAAFSTEFKSVIAVGALDTTSGPPTRAGFSNYGPWVDIYAPGVKVLSTYLDAVWKQPTDTTARPIDGWAYWNGTSFAAPQVAAAIAQARQAGQSAAQAWAAVQAAARALPPSPLPLSAPWPGGLGYIPQPGVIG